MYFAPFSGRRFLNLFILLVFVSTVCYGFEVKQGIIGARFEYDCPGDPTNNTFTFSKLGGQITPDIQINENKLIILKAKVSDGGLYKCTKKPKLGHLGDVVGTNFLLILSEVQKIKFVMIPPAVAIAKSVGDFFQFTCEYDRRNKTFDWQKWNGNPNDSFVSIPRDKVTRVQSDKTTENYVFGKVTFNDTATYRCVVVENGKKRYTNPHLLQVEAPLLPEFRGDFSTVYLDEGDNLSVDLNPDGRPFPNITCFKEGKEIIFCPIRSIDCINGDYEITKSYFFNVEDVYYEDHVGDYTCFATNVAGSVNVTFHVNITVKPMIDRSIKSLIFERENKRGTVNCTISEANPLPTVTWFTQIMKDDCTPKDNLWIPSKLKSKLITYPNGQFRSILNVPAKQPQAFYMCNASNIIGSDQNVYCFRRYRKGQEPISITNPAKLTLYTNEGEKFNVECRVTVSIGGRILFYRRNLNAAVENNTRTEVTLRQDATFRYLTLTIHYLRPNDSDTYQCFTEQLRNQPVSVTVSVKALRPATIVELWNKTANSPEDAFVVLFCNVSGNPVPKVTWFYGGKKIKQTKLNRPNCNQLQTGYYYHRQKSRLFVCKPRQRHTGLYTCFAENALGNETRTAFLYVSARPKIKDRFQMKTIRAEAKLKLTCEAGGNPPPLVQWIKKEGEEDRFVTNRSIRISTLEISSMDKSHIGNYSCNATNSRGTTRKHLLHLEMFNEAATLFTSSDGISTGSIVGIVVGIIVAIVLVVFLILFCWRKQQQKLLFYKHQYFLKTGEYMVDPSRTLNEQSVNLPYDADWEFPFERLVLGDRLGAGAFGEVYKAEAMGILALNPRDKTSTANKRRSKLRRSLRASQRPKKKQLPAPDLSNATVAVKTLKTGATESEIRDLAAELKIMIHLGENKNIVNLLGACTTGRTLYVILEFCPYGNMLSFLRTKRDIYQDTWVKKVFDPDKEFNLIDLVGAAFQVAKGMEFLAGKKLIHRDLAARNILVGDEYVMKISDFGLARDIYKDDVYVKKSSGLLPIKWMAMESLFERTYTHQSDVWSFGVLLWEMMTLGGTPYPGLPPEELLDYLNSDKRMPQPAKCPLEIYTVMRDCWNKDPEQRPTFNGLVEHLGRILEKRLEKENPYLQIEPSQDEIEMAKERDLLVKPKSDYYLEPLLLGTKQKYDANAPLPTPPTDIETPTYPGKDLPEPGLSKNANGGSYARLKEDEQKPVGDVHSSRTSLGNESGIGLQYINEKNTGEVPQGKGSADHLESIV